MTTTAFDYAAPGATCRGQLALPVAHGAAGPDGDGGKRPGVAVFADIGGVGAFTAAFAERLAAECGIVALAADVYGEGAVPADMQQGMAWIGAYRQDPASLRERAGAALSALSRHPRCDGRLAAVGFCFGGGTVLELARANAPGLIAAVSFHGALATTLPAVAAADGASAIAARLLVCHGAEDPIVPPADLTAFLAEMAAARADCQTIAYTGAGHSFTNPEADGSRMPGIKYHEPTARRSWRAMAAHFAEVFGN